jgi:hypothetical protein
MINEKDIEEINKEAFEENKTEVNQREQFLKIYNEDINQKDTDIEKHKDNEIKFKRDLNEEDEDMSLIRVTGVNDNLNKKPLILY